MLYSLKSLNFFSSWVPKWSPFNFQLFWWNNWSFHATGGVSKVSLETGGFFRLKKNGFTSIPSKKGYLLYRFKNFVADHLSWNSNKARLGFLLCLSDCSELEGSVIHKSLTNPNVRDWWNRSLNDTSQGMFWIKKDRLNSLSVRTFESQYWIRTDRSQLLNYNATLLAATLLAMPIVDKFEFQHYSILGYPSGVLSTSNFFYE